ncbi:preprotein translocase subunit YajC [Candidatus Bipolaricaulota bacterium]|nr:preprotein translocase subunit YajC [Candidatus Bipolaricaulota bacterium]
MNRMVLVITGLLVLFVGVAAFGQTEPAAGSVIPLIVILAVFGAVFYFMLIRPQRKRQAKHSELVSALKRGDDVVTAGGIYGEIDTIGDTSIVLALEDGGKIRLSKSSIVDKQAK